jgi:hypothetical protein
LAPVRTKPHAVLCAAIIQAVSSIASVGDRCIRRPCLLELQHPVRLCHSFCVPTLGIGVTYH